MHTERWESRFQRNRQGSQNSVFFLAVSPQNKHWTSKLQFDYSSSCVARQPRHPLWKSLKNFYGKCRSIMLQFVQKKKKKWPNILLHSRPENTDKSNKSWRKEMIITLHLKRKHTVHMSLCTHFVLNVRN